MIQTRQHPTTGETPKSMTFLVEDLERPSSLIPEKPIHEILTQLGDRVEAHGPLPQSLVPFGYHSFLAGMHQAYADHRPFVLSPDMIWMLILQGIAQHIKYEQKIRVELFPQLTTQEQLVVQTKKIRLGDSLSVWDDIPGKFSDQIASRVGGDWIETLRADFTTTGHNERIASEIAIMDAMKPFFKYIVIIDICGIPEITLEGEEKDWAKILDRLSRLGQGSFSEWFGRLIPIIEKIKETASGRIDRDFWRNMFKVHTSEDYGHPKRIDGWITHFFPYDKTGKKINLKERVRLRVESIFHDLPMELSAVDFELWVSNGSGKILHKEPMTFWGGFIGVQQDKGTQALRPEIGWFVGYRREEFRNESDHAYDSDKIVFHNLTAFPEQVLKRKEWESLALHYAGEIIIPKSIASLKIRNLELTGQISKSGIRRLKWLFFWKKTYIIVNGKQVR